jgi:predicted component of type VI protein secretion system
MSFLIIYKMAVHSNEGDRKAIRAELERLLNTRLGIK